jgi:hypothetical protein
MVAFGSGITLPEALWLREELADPTWRVVWTPVAITDVTNMVVIMLRARKRLNRLFASVVVVLFLIVGIATHHRKGIDDYTTSPSVNSLISVEVFPI